ncbi:hypothetical protein J2S50_005939 [Streptomyces sp. DSM 40167]|nr:hypothetical protein [Streptomyces sp. DSM 40167]
MHRAVRTLAEAGIRQFLVTHHLGDAVDGDDVHGLLGRYVDALAPGSHPVLSQVTPDLNPEAVGRAAALSTRGGTPFHPRSLTAFTRFFDGLELLGPGIIPVTGWRPDPQDVAAQAEGIVPVHAGVARKL